MGGDPNVPIKEAMKIAGFSDEEAEDRKKQNNVRQKIRRLAQKEALDNNNNNQKPYHYHQKDISLMVKEEVAKIEAKIDQFVAMFEQRIELKFKELTDRIDEKITSTLSTIAMANKSHEPEGKKGQDKASRKDPE